MDQTRFVERIQKAVTNGYGVGYGGKDSMQHTSMLGLNVLEGVMRAPRVNAYSIQTT